MFTLAISCLTMPNLPGFMDLTFQLPVQYCSLQHQTLLSLPDISPNEHHFCFVPSHFILYWALSNCHPLFSSSILDTFRPGGRGTHLPVLYLFVFSFSPWSSHGKNTGVGCGFPFQWTTFCQSSSLWPIHLWWPCTAWLIASFHKPYGHKAVIVKGILGLLKLPINFFFKSLAFKRLLTVTPAWHPLYWNSFYTYTCVYILCVNIFSL